jgi:23S rRNA (uracil1939-C5)-methyltransferase
MGRSRKKLPATPFELEITSVDAKGMGLAEHEGKKLHVHDTLEDETVLARYLFGRHNRGKAETLEVLRPSPERVEPRCVHFGDCSACNLQHVSMDRQLARKEAALLEHPP